MTPLALLMITALLHGVTSLWVLHQWNPSEGIHFKVVCGYLTGLHIWTAYLLFFTAIG